MTLSFDSCTNEENYLNDLITRDFLVHFFFITLYTLLYEKASYRKGNLNPNVPLLI